MQLKNIPKNVRVFGDLDFRGHCPLEDSETANFVNWVRYQYQYYAPICTHVKNEGRRSYGQASRDKSMGLTKGFADVVILSSPPFALEMKRKDRTKSKPAEEQITHLSAVAEHGGYACIAYGFDAAKAAFLDYLQQHKVKKNG